MFEFFDNFFDVSDGDMDWWCGGVYLVIVFVFDQIQCVGFGDGEIDVGEVDVSFQKFFLQYVVVDLDQCIDVVGVFGDVWYFFVEEFGDFFFGFVDGWYDDV